MTRVFFLSLLSRNFDDRLSSNFHRLVILCICWDTPTVKTNLWQLPIVSTAFKDVPLFKNWLRQFPLWLNLARIRKEIVKLHRKEQFCPNFTTSSVRKLFPVWSNMQSAFSKCQFCLEYNCHPQQIPDFPFLNRFRRNKIPHWKALRQWQYLDVGYWTKISPVDFCWSSVDWLSYTGFTEASVTFYPFNRPGHPGVSPPWNIPWWPMHWWYTVVGLSMHAKKTLSCFAHFDMFVFQWLGSYSQGWLTK